MREVAAYEEHIDHINQTSDALTASGHSESPTIQQEQQNVNYLWMELKDLANGRLEVSDMIGYFSHDDGSCGFFTAVCLSFFTPYGLRGSNAP